jgi:hypothetical protein
VFGSGQLIGTTTFTNSGTIDLQSNPAPGDVLVITGALDEGSSHGFHGLFGGS